jgi:hypothetical protein
MIRREPLYTRWCRECLRYETYLYYPDGHLRIINRRRPHMAPCDMRLKTYPKLHLKTDAQTQKTS